ncbi:hypothetical protein C1646_760959 [Rhizophagus diaphanus]|nr:hypothetical protein C1646_760959 [Rhizophagus diaphanus] [Rhizophagus sp. MUCL 43196]
MDCEYFLTKTRPIILLKTLRKIVVKIITKRLSKTIADHNILKGDLSKAYDRVDIKMLKLAMRRIKIPEILINLMTIYYDPLLTEINSLKLGYEIKYYFKHNTQLDHEEKLIGYSIKDINTIQAQRQLSRKYNQVTVKGVMKDIFDLNCKQLQDELLYIKSYLSLKDLQIKNCLLAHVLALLYDNMLTIRSSRVKTNQIQGSSIPLTNIFTHKELFQKGHIINKVDNNNDKVLIKHWIQDIIDDTISSSINLPIIKKCKGCDVKIELSRINNVIYEVLVQAECKYYGESSAKVNNVKKINSLLRYVYLKNYCIELLEISKQLKHVKDLEIYTNGSMRNLTIHEMKIGCNFIISLPFDKKFNCNISNNPSSNKAELMVVILSLIVCPKALNIMIYTDSQWVVNIFHNFYMSTMLEIEKSKVNYKILWLLLFKMIKIYELKVNLVKVKAYDNNEYNISVDKLAKLDTDKKALMLEDTLLLYNGSTYWRDILIERNPILMIKGIKDAQFINDFFILNKNIIYQQQELLIIKICCDELPTYANLKKHKPDLYDDS